MTQETKPDPEIHGMQTLASKVEKAYTAYQANHFESARSLCEQVLEEDNDNKIASQLLPVLLFKLGEPEQAVKRMEQAVKKWPEYAEIHYSLSLMYLWLGDFARGWREYEWRLKVESFGIPALNLPRWNGSFIDSKSIVVLCEQGYGDSIQFARYLPLLKQKSVKLILVSPKVLAPLFRKMECIDEVHVPTAESRFQADCFVNLASLPRIFAANYHNIPATVKFKMPPLSRDEPCLEQFQDNKLTIGIAWSGREDNENNAIRSCGFEYFAALARDIPGLQLVTLQLHDEMANVHEDIIQAGTKIQDFGHTAQILEQIDLVICIETAITHLALTQGIATWVLLSTPEDWRWVTHAGVCPWYPQARFFQQTKRDNWDDVFEEITTALQSLMKDQA